MPDEYYPNPGDDMPETPSGSDAGDQEPAEKSEGSDSFLVPKSALEGKEANPGDEFVFEVVRVYEDEVEFKYATGESKGEDYGDKGTMKESMGDMDRMAGEMG